MLRILGRANSFNVRKVLWTCEELGIAFTRENWGRGFRPTNDPDFLRINPVGLVPAVIDDNETLLESNTIVRYLATKHGSDEFYPRDPLQRARTERWMDWANYETSISCAEHFSEECSTSLPGIIRGLSSRAGGRSRKKWVNSTHIFP